MSGSTVGAFWAVSFLFVMTPGADWAYAIAAGLRHRSVVPAVCGLLCGHLLATAVVAAGVGTLVTRTPSVLVGLTVAGAAYVIWLGVTTLRSPSTIDAGGGGASTSSVRQAWTGAGISGLNPKVLLLFVALLPQFTDAAEPWSVPVQIAVLGLVHTTSCAVVYAAVALGARRVLAARPAAARAVTRLSGAAMVTVGATLLVDRLVA